MLFQKFLDNNCSEEEWQKVRAYFSDLDSDDTLDQLIKIEMQKYLSEEVNIDQRLTDEMLGNIIGQINKDENPKVKLREAKPPRFFENRKFLQIVASVLFVCVLSFTVYLLSEYKFMANSTLIYVEKSTEIGESSQIVLPDGSKVWLNNASKIKYLKNFSSKSREVILEGEAYFDVKSDSLKPFIVHASGIQTKVLGTSFNINAYKELSAVAVSVTKGKVAVSDSLNSFAVLEKDQRIEIDKQSKAFQMTEGNSNSLLGWREGRLIFHQATFLEIKSALHNKYGLQIRFENEKLKNCRFTATFENDDKPLEILDMLNLLHGTSYEIENNVITISGNGCEVNIN